MRIFLKCCLLLFVSGNIFAQQHTFSAFNPATGATGEVITITGTNFTSTGMGVTFGGTNATSVVFVNETTIQATIGAGTSGTISVTKSGFSARTQPGFIYSAYPLVQSIVTNHAGYWNTSIQSPNAVQPNGKHELLSFSYNGTRYSTGVNNAVLTSNSLTFTSGNWRAFPVAGIIGVTSGTALNLTFGSIIDGNLTAGVASSPAVAGKTVKDQLTDGIRGLDLGTGVTNLPTTSILAFNVFSIASDKISDSEPDILVTQTAQPAAGTDTYSFVDVNGNIVGNTVSQEQSALSRLGTYRLDLFRLINDVPLSTATTTGVLFETANGTRDIRLSAYRLSDFGITVANYASIVGLRINPSGTSDPAFLAYNANSINFRPTVDRDLNNSNAAICAGGSAFLKVIASPANEGTLSYTWQENTGSGWNDLTEGGNYTGTTTAQLTVANAVVGRQYRAVVVESGTNYSTTSAAFTISTATGIAAPTINTQPVASSTGCLGANILLFAVPTGGSGAYTYQWQSASISGGPFTNINGATTNSYTPPTTTAGTMYYRVVVSNVGCTGSVNSNQSVVTLTGGATLAVTNGERCGSGTVALSVTPSTSSTVTWRDLDNNVLTTGNSYTTPSLTYSQNYYVTATTTSPSCTSATYTVTATVKAYPAFTTQPVSLKLPTGNTATFTTATDSSGCNFQWYFSSNAISSATSSTYTIPTAELSNNGTYYVTATRGNCTAVASGNATLNAVVDLYSKTSTDINLNSTWGVETDGSGTNPTTFTNSPAISTRPDHIFHVMNSASTLTNITLAGTLDVENATVTITPGTLVTSGLIRRSGTTGAFIGSRTSSIALSGISGHANNNSALYFNQTSGNNILQNLTFANSGTTTLGSALRLVGELTPTAGTLASSGNLTLVSDALGTARVNERPNGATDYVTGNVTVERYVPGFGDNPLGGPGRKWRLLTIPVENATATIRDFWAASQAPRDYVNNPANGAEPENNGTVITGLGSLFGTNGSLAVAAGFDYFAGLDHRTVPSIRYYSDNGTTGSWGINNYPSIHTTATPQQGYMLFIRGDRTLAHNDNGIGRTTLTPKGTLKMGNRTLTIPATSSQQYVVFGNPYAGPIDFAKVMDASETENLAAVQPYFRTFDASLPGPTFNYGGYRLISKVENQWIATPPYAGATHIQHIQSGQAVMLDSKVSSGTGTLTIRESHKATNTTSAMPFDPITNQIPQNSLLMNVYLFDGNGQPGLADGLRAFFGTNYQTAATDAMDIKKAANFSGSLSLALKNGNQRLAIEARPEIKTVDTLQISFNGLTNRKYRLEWESAVELPNGGTAVLVDKYAGVFTNIEAGTLQSYEFTPTEDSIAKLSDRFYIVFTAPSTLPVNFLAASAYKKGKENIVTWTTAVEANLQGYTVEKSSDGIQFATVAAVKAKGGQTNQYTWADAHPVQGNQYYRILAKGLNGELKYSAILLLRDIVQVNKGVQVYPNPLKGQMVALELNNMQQGNYTIRLVNAAGQEVVRRTITHPGGNSTQSVQAGTLAKGIYEVQVYYGTQLSAHKKVTVE